MVRSALAQAPVVWLLGKVQSGKTSIVRTLTQSSDAEIGEGYKACTRASRVFDFPQEAPVIRFLDTRGLGEAGYDPTEDIAFCRTRAQVLLVVLRALDPQQDAILEVVNRVRKGHPSWPVIIAQTVLHDGYPRGMKHIMPYPFGHSDAQGDATAAVPNELVRALAFQRALFSSLPGSGSVAFVPIDFTVSGDGFEPRDYGLDALLAALETAAPLGLLAMLRDTDVGAVDAFAQRAHPHIIGYAAAAASADLLPAAGVVAVPALQAKMLHSLSAIYGVALDRRALSEFAGCLGAGTVTRLLVGFGIRELVKFVPVYGQIAGAAAAATTSFATTYALGKAAAYFLNRRRTGTPDPEGVARTYADALSEAFRMNKIRAKPDPTASAT